MATYSLRVVEGSPTTFEADSIDFRADARILIAYRDKKVVGLFPAENVKAIVEISEPGDEAE